MLLIAVLWASVRIPLPPVLKNEFLAAPLIIPANATADTIPIQSPVVNLGMPPLSIDVVMIPLTNVSPTLITPVATGLRRIEIIQPSLIIEVVSAVTERIEYSYAAFAICSVGIQHRMIAPCIIAVFYHYVANTVKYSHNVALCVAAVENIRFRHTLRRLRPNCRR